MTIQLLEGDCRETLKTIPDRSVQVCVTSPPYYGLRDYGTASWEGGDAECDHKPGNEKRVGKTTLQGGKKSTGHKQEGFFRICSKCGARRIDNQIGLEDTPEAYVEKLVAVFREVKPKLKDNGTLWLNIGDSYAGSGRGTGEQAGEKQRTNREWDSAKPKRRLNLGNGLKAKDLIGIPWMVAFALRADGWWLRSEIVWWKPNAMPESVKDRPTKSHEQIFLLSKSAKCYYDAAAIAEPANQAEMEYRNRIRKGIKYKTKEPYEVNYTYHYKNTETKNKRDVWMVNTKPYEGAHFATYPTELIEPCVLAGSKEGDIVLDPFAGSGTTMAVAIKHRRNGIACELNPDYIELIKERLKKVQIELLSSH